MLNQKFSNFKSRTNHSRTVTTHLRKTEFTYNPELVLTSDFNPKTIEFDGIKIGQTINELSTEK